MLYSIFSALQIQFIYELCFIISLALTRLPMFIDRWTFYNADLVAQYKDTVPP